MWQSKMTPKSQGGASTLGATGGRDGLTLLKRSWGTYCRTIGSMVSTLANCTSGMYKAQTTWAHPGEANKTESGDSHGATQKSLKLRQGCRQAWEAEKEGSVGREPT